MPSGSVEPTGPMSLSVSELSDTATHVTDDLVYTVIPYLVYDGAPLGKDWTNVGLSPQNHLPRLAR